MSPTPRGTGQDSGAADVIEPGEAAGAGDHLADPAATSAAGGGVPELMANSVTDYAGIWLKRVRNGESGALPIILGLVAIVIFFQVKNSLFLSSGNLVNLMIQGVPFILLGMAEVFVLLLGEIDLSTGYNAAIAATITLWAAYTLPWWVAILCGLAVSAFFGALWGVIITRLGLPSFVVTLAGYLGLEGFLIVLVPKTGHGSGGSISDPSNILNDFTQGSLSPVAGWVVMIVLVALAGVFMVSRDRRRRASGLVAPPLGVTLLKIAVMAVAGIVVVLVGNTNRGLGFTVLRGVPWAVFIVLGVLVLYTVLTSRTRFGRYVYAIGGNAEAARRAGVSLNGIRTMCFMLCGLTAGIAGIMLSSQLGSIGTDINGGEYVLFAVASAVIGGTNLFGGRGKMIHALLGGLVIAVIYNGLGLIGLSAGPTFIVTALVLLAAVTIDTLARRRGATT